jgi:hypothetical protein
MKRSLLLASLIAAIASARSAGSCGTALLASYIALGSGGCTIRSDTLFNFQALGGTAGMVPILPASVIMSPLGGAFNPGISVAANVTSPAGIVMEALFTYRISGSAFIADSITLANSSETGDGAVTDTQNFCVGGIFGSDGVTGCTGIAGSLVALGGVQNTNSTSLGPASLLSVTADFTIDGGIAGSASGGTIVDQFAASPDPASIISVVLAIGLGTGLKLRSSARRRR